MTAELWGSRCPNHRERVELASLRIGVLQGKRGVFENFAEANLDTGRRLVKTACPYCVIDDLEGLVNGQ